VRLCGPLVLEVDGRRLERALPSRQGRMAFAYLVLARPRAGRRDELIDAVWPGPAPGAVGGAAHCAAVAPAWRPAGRHPGRSRAAFAGSRGAVVARRGDRRQRLAPRRAMRWRATTRPLRLGVPDVCGGHGAWRPGGEHDDGGSDGEFDPRHENLPRCCWWRSRRTVAADLGWVTGWSRLGLLLGKNPGALLHSACISCNGARFPVARRWVSVSGGR
jgi:hypothetical protein